MVQAEMFTQKQARKEPALNAPVRVEPGQYVLPDLTMLDVYETESTKPDWKKLEQNGAVLEENRPISVSREKLSVSIRDRLLRCMNMLRRPGSRSAGS